MSIPTRDFAEELAFSQELADAPWWEQVYREAFPDFRTMVDLRQDGWHQRAGRDRAIVLSSGKTVYVDEKGRRKDYGDILVEVWSVYPPSGTKPYPDRKGAKPGWACEPKDTDWLAYAVVPTRKCYLLPLLGLRAAWVKKGHRWTDLATREEQGFRWTVSPNSGYNSIGIAVPIEILYKAINNAMTVTWLPPDETRPTAAPPDDREYAEEEEWPPLPPMGGAA